ncbi:transcription factor GLABRA 3-like isoform X2 [Andrographis paniculata]|nr:transcription factor GLABRA 3-like isoform X2 [Andrographis paniculata]XP_051137000.1 transcription factor GLABRA 3-like isoform X2 [Andrographis paniculata]
MATADHRLKEVPQDLRKQLALAVRSIQWSYAIFWSISSRKPGVLEWSDGYYNGEIKTRKTVQAAESDASDQLGLQRSDQLRELYASLSLGETNPQAKRPTAALSPEDLTDAEWYFLVCMSFVFNPDQGLPGRTLVKNQTIWLCNAHRADTKVFARSLLAKSASIQTIVCFPHLDGVVELGTNEHISEDLSLVQYIKASFLENPSTNPSTIPNHVVPNIVPTDEGACDRADISQDGLDRILESPDREACSPNNCSNDFADHMLREESNFLEGTVNGEASQVQNWPLMDDAVSNCLNNSMTSSDCVSQTYGDPVTTSDGKRETNSCTRDNQECNQQKNASGFQGNENHYHMVLSNLLKNSHEFILGPYFTNGGRRSSFVSWRNDGLFRSQVPKSGSHQVLLKKVLFDVARMHENNRRESSKGNGKSKPESEEIDRNHVLSERKRREKINERFAILGSLVPAGGKVDKVSILDHTIEYLRKLEKKVGELESCKEAHEVDSTTQSKPHDAIERTSDNYGPSKASNNKKQSSNKRKACEIDKSGSDGSKIRLRNASADNVTVNVANNDVVIEMRCSWKKNVLLEVMAAVNELHMDIQTVQSSDSDGTLSLTIKAKGKGLKAASAGVIRQALQKIIKKS